MAFLAALPLAAAFPRRARRAAEQVQEREKTHECHGQMRLKTRTEDGRAGWDCWCRTAPHRVLASGTTQG